MKKKILLSLLVILGLFIITGCGNNKANPEAEEKANDILNNQTETKTKLLQKCGSFFSAILIKKLPFPV